MNPPQPMGTGEGTAVPASSTTLSKASLTSSSNTTAAPLPLLPPTPLLPPLTRRVRLTKAHTHAGFHKHPGEDIELLHDLADWLIAQGSAEEVSSQAASLAVPPALSDGSKPTTA